MGGRQSTQLRGVFQIMTAKILQFPKPAYDKDFTKSDRQTIDATELLVEYMYEAGCDINRIVESKELGDVIHRLHICISKANGQEQDVLDVEKGIDISFLYNDNGFLKDPK